MEGGVQSRGAWLITKSTHFETRCLILITVHRFIPPFLSPGNSRPTSSKSDSELITNLLDSDSQNPAMLWAWGELPQAATVQKHPPLTRLKSVRSFSFNTHLHFFSLHSSPWSRTHSLFVFYPSLWLRTHTSVWSPTRCPQNNVEPALRLQHPRCWRRRTQRGQSRYPRRWKLRRWLQRRRRWATWRRRPLVLSGRQTLLLKRKVRVAVKRKLPW